MAARVEAALMALPAISPARHVRPLLFDGVEAFFEAEPFGTRSAKKATHNRCQRQVRLPFDQSL